ncbi:serine/threonine-protein kinase [Virgisporangium aurantiacum]|uniref:serine/threonine-protein kinase n=1 Tax=Virgisporangium aurantiacum TaxID=175570 RepID=UPI00194DFC79|nr:serine/threonine-protein kinase [Virgisporangium aurantiacum]
MPGLTGLSVLARGGYATVYRAMQESVGRLVAVKVENGILENERDQRRFMREARAAGRMSSHPHVVDLFDAGVTIDGHPFLIMELCQGSYSERMRRMPLPPAEVRDVGVKIADALADAHELGVLHRDVKPANILMTHFGEPALADFGLAVVTENRDISITLDVLTPAYAPPEMFNHAPPAPAADVYSLCATLYALLAGRPPRWPNSRDPSLASLVDMFADPIPDLPHVPRDLMGLVLRGMSNVDAARPRAAELRDLLLAMELGAVSPHAIPTGMLRHQSAPGADDADSGETQVVNPGGPLAPAAPPTAPVLSVPPAAGWPGAPGMPGQHGVAGSPGMPGPLGPPGSPGMPGPIGMAGSPGMPGSPGVIGSLGMPGSPGVIRSSGVAGSPGDFGSAVSPEVGSPGLGFVPGGRGGVRSASPHEGVARPTRTPRLRRLLMAGIAAGYLLALAAVAVAGMRMGSADPATTFVAAPVKSSPTCPLSPAGTAQCVQQPECFNGVTVQGGVARAAAVACTEPHVWEVFATAPLPEGLDTASHTTIKQNQQVRQVCSATNARALNTQQNWQVEVLPPSREQVRNGDRTYRCLAGTPPSKLRDSRFVR